MQKRRRLERTTSRTARRTAVFLLELHLLARGLGSLAMSSRPVVLLNQVLRQLATDGWQRITYFGHDQWQEAGLAAAQCGDEGEQGVEVFLGPGLEFARLERNARHYVDEGAGYVKDFFNL